MYSLRTTVAVCASGPFFAEAEKIPTAESLHQGRRWLQVIAYDTQLFHGLQGTLDTERVLLGYMRVDHRRFYDLTPFHLRDSFSRNTLPPERHVFRSWLRNRCAGRPSAQKGYTLFRDAAFDSQKRGKVVQGAGSLSWVLYINSY